MRSVSSGTQSSSRYNYNKSLEASSSIPDYNFFAAKILTVCVINHHACMQVRGAFDGSLWYKVADDVKVRKHALNNVTTKKAK